MENLTVIANMETDEGEKKAERDGAAIRQTERIPDSTVLTDILKFLEPFPTFASFQNNLVAVECHRVT